VRHGEQGDEMREEGAGIAVGEGRPIEDREGESAEERL